MIAHAHAHKYIKLQNRVSKIHFFEKKLQKNLHISKKSSTFAP